MWTLSFVPVIPTLASLIVHYTLSFNDIFCCGSQLPGRPSFQG